ncbi:hypothetical protein BAUCODRAFT_464067 [Baudoinia panamericana UAMH 10762]|uniref:Uncharacterized protein n=1 Tax=Baudoinia panamericana (strain UAMH 10762) TaxID=717646 RepID=M2MM34_BAUPA|nr:uncharacterized protein BAUCODRAFT_464067 [Baudoinia panamericana UAMH 10762]EMC97741.1 hypothetical protein BAUCODRAFT_464067 [Baudoinia panamericana UAMH 10762]
MLLSLGSVCYSKPASLPACSWRSTIAQKTELPHLGRYVWTHRPLHCANGPIVSGMARRSTQSQLHLITGIDESPAPAIAETEEGAVASNSKVRRPTKGGIPNPPACTSRNHIVLSLEEVFAQTHMEYFWGGESKKAAELLQYPAVRARLEDALATVRTRDRLENLCRKMQASKLGGRRVICGVERAFSPRTADNLVPTGHEGWACVYCEDYGAACVQIEYRGARTLVPRRQAQKKELDISNPDAWAAAEGRSWLLHDGGNAGGA